MTDLIIRATTTNVNDLARALATGASATLDAYHRTGGDPVTVRIYRADEDTPEADPVITIPGGHATVTVHGLDHQRDIGDRLHACARVSVAFAGAAPVTFAYGDFDLGQVYEVDGRDLTEQDMLGEAALTGSLLDRAATSIPDEERFEAVEQVESFLDYLIRGAYIVMERSVAAPVLDPRMVAITDAIENHNENYTLTGSAAAHVVTGNDR